MSTRYWHALDDGRIQCDVCPRVCKLNEGQRGMCFVRARQDDQVVLTSYGRSSGFCVDPIEKKPLNHFLPGTPILSFGTAGCNLACRFCQNWDMSKSREMDTLMDEASPEGLAEAAERLGCRSVAFTYNDPVIFMEYAIDTAQACHERGIKSVAVTAGYICEEPRRELYRYMDAANVDLKAFTEDFYSKVCAGHLQDVLDTLVYLKHETDVWFEITTLLIPGENDSAKEIEAECQWVVENLGVDVPLHFTAFHPDWKMMDHPPTPPPTLQPGPQDRPRARHPLRLRRQRPRPRGRYDLLPRLRHDAHRARLVHAPELEPHRRRSVCGVRRPLCRRLRRPSRRLGAAASAGSPPESVAPVDRWPIPRIGGGGENRAPDQSGRPSSPGIEMSASRAGQ